MERNMVVFVLLEVVSITTVEPSFHFWPKSIARCFWKQNTICNYRMLNENAASSGSERNSKWCFSGLHLFTVQNLVTLHLSEQNSNFQNCVFNLHIIVSLVHIQKGVPHSFEQVANAFVHPSSTILCFIPHFQLLMSQSKCTTTYNTCYQNFSHSRISKHLLCWQPEKAIETPTCHSEPDMFIDRYTLLRDELKTLREKSGFATDPRCFANVEKDSRNAPKQRRTTKQKDFQAKVWLHN